MPAIQVNGASLHVKDTGEGEALVLVHGTGANADAWDLVSPLLASSHRVIAYDRRAYQRSTGAQPPSRDYYRQHGEDLAELLRVLGAVPATVVAWSGGSFPALHAALKYPERIRQLVLYEPPLHAARNPTWPLFKTFATVGLMKALGKPQAAAGAFLRMVMAYADGRSSLDNFPAALRAGMVKDIPALLAELDAGTGEELTPAQLSTVKPPVKLMLGDQSPALFTAAMRRLQNIYPKAPLISIPGANHIALIDLPEVFAQSLRTAITA